MSTASTIEVIQRAILLAGIDDPSDCSPPRPEEWSSLLTWIEQERLVGLALWAAEEGLPLTDAQIDDIVERHRAAMHVAVRAERSALRVWDLLSAEGIPSLVVKGAATARLAYPEPERRQFGDVDLLVPDSLYEQATELMLAELGTSRLNAELHGDTVRSDRHSSGHRLGDGTEVDLHRNLGRWPLHRFDTRPAFDDPRPLELAGRPMATLSPELHLITALAHDHLLTGRLSIRRDLIGLDPLVDPARVAEVLDGHRGLIPMARRLVGELPLPGLATALDLLGPVSPGPLDRTRWVLNERAERQVVRSVLQSLTGASAPRALAEMIWPDRTFLAAKGRTRRTHLVRYARALMPGRARDRAEVGVAQVGDDPTGCGGPAGPP